MASRVPPAHGKRPSSSGGGGLTGQRSSANSDTVEIVVDIECGIGSDIDFDIIGIEAPSATATDEAMVTGELGGVPAECSHPQVSLDKGVAVGGGRGWGGGGGGEG